MTGMSPPVDDRDGPPTQPNLGSYSTFQGQALRSAKHLDQVVLLSRKRVDFIDKEREDHAKHLARELRALARRFGKWPEMGGEAIALDRAELVPKLFNTLRAALTLLESVPKVGALGKVRRG